EILRRLGRGRLVICLAARLVSVAELLFLLVEHVASAIHPVPRLFARPASLLPHALAAFLRLGANYVACFLAGMRRVQHTHDRSDTETRQKPQEAIAFMIRHNRLLNFSMERMVAPSICETQFTASRPASQARAGFPQRD